MRKLFFKFTIILLASISCTKLEVPQCKNCNFDCLVDGEKDIITNKCLPNYQCSFKLISNSRFSKNEYLGFEKGNKLVFQMITETQGDERIADDEYTNILVFEIPTEQTSFRVSGADLKNISVHYKTVCYCVNVAFIAASDGCIQGEKQSDGSWLVQGKLTIPFSYGDQVLKIAAHFK